MPTGYTYKIKDGISFKEFALNCAKAFGALMSLRDAPADAEIPDEFPPSTYHRDNIKVAQAKRDQLRKMAQAQWEKAYRAECRRIKKDNKRRERESEALEEKYRAMLDQVQAWKPPTSEHIEMKAFMVDQILKSIEWDCGKIYEEKRAAETPEQWHLAQLAAAADEVVYHKRGWLEEQKRCAGRTNWVSALKRSLEEEDA